MTVTVDRPAAIRRALRDLVAERGFHGASMSAVAKAAGVATGTAYVHYASKDDLVIATYLEIKSELADTVLAEVDAGADLAIQYRQAFTTTYHHMREVPERARFLTQLEGSPYREVAHRAFLERGDRLVQELMPRLADVLVRLPPDIIWALSLGQAIQLASTGTTLDQPEFQTLIDATWDAVTR